MANKRIIHWTTVHRKFRGNAAFLVGCFYILELRRKPEEAIAILEANNLVPYSRFQDANGG